MEKNMKNSFQLEINKDLKEKKANETERTLANVATSLGISETVQRYGSAIAEDLVGYSGQRLNSDGSVTSYQKSHSKIYTHKINPEYEQSNIAQQAGYNAEVNHVTQENKKAIIEGKPTRVTRSDDLGRVNDTVADIIILDASGNPIMGSEGQMKFVNDPKKVCDGIAGLKTEGSKNDLTRYRNNKLLLPTEDVELTKEYCRKQAKELKENAARQNNAERADQMLEQAQEFKKLEKNIVDAGFSREQAKAYRLNPIKETVKSIGRTAHDAGIQGATFGASIGGSISLVSNVYALYQGDKKLGEAVCDCAVDTAKSVAMGYTTGFAGAAIKGAMEQSHGVLLQRTINNVVGSATGKKAVEKLTKQATEEFQKSTTGQISKRLNSLSKTNLPALAVTVCLEFGGLIRQYAKREIDGVEFMERMGEKGIGMISSSAMAAVGQIAIPIPVVGAVIGGMIGYTLSSLFYNEALNAFKGAKQAHEEYLFYKAKFEEAKRQRDIYQTELQKQFNLHMSEKRHEFSLAFQQIDVAVETGDMVLFSQNINQIGDLFNKKLQFSNRDEFDDFMNTSETFIL